MMPLRNFKILVLFGLMFGLLPAQELPPVNNYSPVQYNAENQNWAISQDENQLIYIANNKGLLVFNGSDWQLYPSPNETIMRSVKVIGDKIYTGCYMEFGFWKRNQFGELDYTSLSKTIDKPLEQDEHFWNIVSLDNWVLFQSYNRIYIYDVIKESFEIIESDATINNLFNVNGSIYFQRFGVGLFKIQNGKDTLISNDTVLNENVIANIYSSDENLLIHTQNEGVYFLRENRLFKWPKNINNVLENKSVYSSKHLQDGSFIVGTISNGVYHFDKNGDFKFQITQKNGLNNNTVLSVFEDNERNIWLGLDNGISSININSPVKVFFDDQGKLGTVYTSALFNGNLYVGTNQGLFYKKYLSQDEFTFVDGTQGQVWSLNKIDNSLFCGHNSGTFIIDNNRAIRISNIQGTWTIKPIPDRSDLLLQGNYDGLYVLEKKNGWSLRNKIVGFNNSSRFVEIEKPGKIFINHEYKGVFKVNTDTDYRSVTSISKDSVNKGLHSSIVKFNGDLLYAYKEGVFTYNSEDDIFVKDTIFSQVFKQSEYTSGKLVKSRNDLLWFFTKDAINFFSPGKLTSKPVLNQITIPSHIRNTVTSYESVLDLGNEKYLIGTTSGYLTLDLNKLFNKDFEVTIHSATSSNIRRKTHRKLPVSNDTIIDFNHNSLRFTFSSPEYNRFYEMQYQTRLEGIYNEWSDWSTIPFKDYENLPSGDYTFSLRARLGNTYSKNIEAFSFTIDRPWYFSKKMMAVYFGLLILTILLIHNLYKAYYRKQQNKLLLEKQKEMDMKEMESKQELMRLRNQGLKQDIKNKNKELAVSTMSLIKKNEFLNHIKDELKRVDTDNKLNAVIKIIDKNLNNTDDWKLFEEAFNNADKDFLKKIKKAHPSLTSNDLRLCAYLRLNLSSKEIAPLLNISPRSVEVKRYRLRKKMSLSHDDSLSDYILRV